MCKDLSNIRVPHSEDAGLTFRNMLLTRCQVEFYKNSEVKLNRETRLKEIQQITDPVSSSLNVFGGGLILLLCLSSDQE
jgi:hypothetical protein